MTLQGEATFHAKAPGIMRLLMADFPLTEDDAAAIVGNLGHECAGFTKLQEQRPTVKGSKGGYGWAQWTGPRRRAYEAYCARNKLDKTGDKANYAYLWLELTTTHKNAIPAVRGGTDLLAKVVAFEKAYEGAGVKHYDSRLAYAKAALDAYGKSPQQPVQPKPAPAGTTDQPPRPSLASAILSVLAAIFNAIRVGDIFNAIFRRK